MNSYIKGKIYSMNIYSNFLIDSLRIENSLENRPSPYLLCNNKQEQIPDTHNDLDESSRYCTRFKKKKQKFILFHLYKILHLAKQWKRKRINGFQQFQCSTASEERGRARRTQGGTHVCWKVYLDYITILFFLNFHIRGKQMKKIGFLFLIFQLHVTLKVS